MESVGRARRIRIYVNEGDRIGHLPAHLALMQFLRKEGARGATVFRGIEGFGAAGEVHVSHLADVVGRLPLVVEWIDQAERVERLLPPLRALLRHGFITADDTEILLQAPRPVRVLNATVTAAGVMSRELTTAAPETPVRELVSCWRGTPTAPSPSSTAVAWSAWSPAPTWSSGVACRSSRGCCPGWPPASGSSTSRRSPGWASTPPTS